MAEDDEEKIRFHTEEGVYCLTHMPKGLKYSAVTLQRMMEKVLANQKGQNVEIYLEEIVERIRADPEKIPVIMRSLTPKDPNQIRSLSLKLIAINKFIPKLAELMHPIREVRKALDVTNGSGWTNEAEKAF
ncbi:hypothetical protein Tco_0161713 [Tanacetum coccineum]